MDERNGIAGVQHLPLFRWVCSDVDNPVLHLGGILAKKE
jgi:hypothetical protein